MSRWLIKTSVQRAISWLPAHHRWNELFQNLVTRSLELSQGQFESTLSDSALLREKLDAYANRPMTGFTALELGTGWIPIVPVGFYLCGAERVWTYDIASYLNAKRLRQTFERFLENHESGRLKQLLPHLQPGRVERLRELLQRVNDEPPAALLAKLNIEVRLCDARQSGLPDGSVDLIYSRLVLAHIPPPVLAGLFAEFRRVAAPGALNAHRILLSDQFACFDRNISKVNFLKFSPRAWRWLNSPIIPQNRLRISDYRKIFAAAGFRILEENNTTAGEAELAGLRIAPEFAERSREDLLTAASFLIATPETKSTEPM